MTDGQPSKPGTIADWWTRLVQAMAGIVARDPRRPNLFWSGDLVEGVVAVVALLLMVAIGIREWLAILLAVLTYVGVALLRPQRERREVTVIPPVPPRLEEAHVYQLVANRYGLTRRETEIVPMLERRLSDKEIAERLSISPRTAMNHSASILGKLGLDSRRDVADFVERHRRLLPSSPPNVDE